MQDTTKGQAENFIKGELSKVLVKKDPNCNPIPSQKAVDFVASMNPVLRSEFGIQRMIVLFGDATSYYYTFIKVQ